MNLIIYITVNLNQTIEQKTSLFFGNQSLFPILSSLHFLRSLNLASWYSQLGWFLDVHIQSSARNIKPLKHFEYIF